MYISCNFNVYLRLFFQLTEYPGGGDSAYERGGDAHRKF